MRACVRACVRAYVRACVCARACAWRELAVKLPDHTLRVLPATGSREPSPRYNYALQLITLKGKFFFLNNSLKNFDFGMNDLFLGSGFTPVQAWSGVFAQVTFSLLV